VNFDLPVKRDSLDEPDIDLYLLRLPERARIVPSWESRKDFELAFIEAGIRSRLMNSSPIKKPILTYNGSTSLGNCSTSTKLASHIVGD
ncbi:hypothetical protein Tco_1205393, partial [Tanacetum coccineum]